MFNVSILEYFSVLNMFIVCIRNTTMFKLIPLLRNHVYSYMFSTVHPRDSMVVRMSLSSAQRRFWYLKIENIIDIPLFFICMKVSKNIY